MGEGAIVSFCLSCSTRIKARPSCGPLDAATLAEQARGRGARIMHELYLDRLRAGLASDTTGRLTRFEIPLSGNDPPTVQTLAEDSFDLPRLNYSRIAGRHYRFVWGSGDEGGDDFSIRLVKIDVTAGKTLVWREEGCHPGEPVFVASPGAAAEDDGAWYIMEEVPGLLTVCCLAAGAALNPVALCGEVLATKADATHASEALGGISQPR